MKRERVKLVDHLNLDETFRWSLPTVLDRSLVHVDCCGVVAFVVVLLKSLALWLFGCVRRVELTKGNLQVPCHALHFHEGECMPQVLALRSDFDESQQHHLRIGHAFCRNPRSEIRLENSKLY